MFHEQLDLPCFAAFPLLRSGSGRELLRRYYHAYAQLAVRFGAGFVLESPGWRGNPDWGQLLGFSASELNAVNRDGIALMREIREAHETLRSPMVVSGNLGPRGDGYKVGSAMSPEQAAAYHLPQIEVYREAGADMVSAFTMSYAAEALGIAAAAASVQIPCVISFTVETDGRLPDGRPLGDAIDYVDGHATQPPAYYMINCAHPTHFAAELAAGASWLSRIGGLRANASCRSHAELDGSSDLDSGDPAELGRQYRRLREVLPRLNVLGGCCGTDHRHLEAICESCLIPHGNAA